MRQSLASPPCQPLVTSIRNHPPNHRSGHGAWIIVALGLVFIACGNRSSANSPTAPGTITPTTSGAIKPLIVGLTDMGSLQFHQSPTGIPDNSLTAIASYPGAFQGKVINIAWAQLQPTPQSFDPTAIDQALSDIAAYNKLHPTAPLLAKLRVFSNNNAPTWAKAMPGGPITIYSAHNMVYTDGPFWSTPYIQAWRHLQSLLAARYDTNPLLAVVASASCSSVSDEPFILALNQPSITNLLAAGFTDAAYQSCLLGQNDDYADWKQTRIEETFNPYFQIGNGKVTQDINVTIQAMRLCHDTLGARCILSNHGWILPNRPAAQPIYDEMRTLGSPISLQNYSPQTMQTTANGTAVLRAAISLGASSVEIWTMEFTKFPPATLQQWAALFPSS